MDDENAPARLNSGFAATPKRKKRRGLGFESLEHRRVLTTLTVNTTADTNCVDVETSPTDSNGRISLRSAVQFADNNVGPYTINLPNNLGTYDLTIGAMTLGNNAVNLDENITIQGVTSTGALASPASVVIDQTQQTRIFISTYPPSGLHLQFNDLTMENGQTPTTSTSGGSCMYVGNGDQSVTTINNCVITGCISNDGGPGAVTLNNGGTLVVVDTTFTNNRTTGSGGFGAAIDYDNTSADAEGNAPTGNFLVQSCTFIGNTAATVGGSAIEADDIVGNGDMNILDSSFINNSVTSSVYNGGAIMETTGALNVSGCVFFGNTCSNGNTGIVQAADEGIGTITANNNWWGANAFPGTGGAETITGDVSVTERLDLVLAPTSSVIGLSGATGLTAKVVYDTAYGPGGIAVAGTALDGSTVTFAAGGLPGTSVTPVSAVLLNGVASSTLLSGTTPGIATPTVAFETTAAAATVTVSQAPQVTTQPSNASVNVGQTATFTANAAIGFPAPTVQWMVSTNGGVSFSSLTNGSAGGATYSGVNTNTLSIAGTTLAMNGYQYEAVYSNGSGSATSAAATLSDAINFTSLASTTLTEGVAGSFTVAIAAGSPAGTTLSESGSLPSGVTFVDNGNGTATLSGTAAHPSTGTYNLVFTAWQGGVASGTQNFTLTIQPALFVSSANSSTFIAGTSGTFTVTTQTLLGGVPTLTPSGSLPSGVTFVDNGNGTATLSGVPAAGSGGSYPITITAANGTAPNFTQSFTLNVNEASTVNSANNTTFTVGSPGTFTVTTTNGFPVPASLTETGSLPSGVTFVDNGNGTATLAGTPAATSGRAYPITITASNGTSPNITQRTQSFTLTVDEPPQINSAASTTFDVGTSGTFSITTSPGFPAATISTTSTLPTGVSLTNNGDGTATLSGTPAAGTAGVYPLSLKATNGTPPDAAQSFTLNVDPATTFTVGSSGTFAITPPYNLTGATSLSTTSPLPSGVTFVDTGATATLSGTPSAATGGTYAVTITASQGANTATETVLLTVNEAPTITSANSVSFDGGLHGSFTVTTAHDFPAGTTLSETGSLPSGVTFVDNGNGTATLSGTPAATAAAVNYPLMINASNGVSPSAAQSFTLTVLPSADLGVSLSASSPTDLANGNLTYTVIVSNYGPTLAQNVTLGLPLGVFSFVSQTQTAGPGFALSNTASSVTDTLSSLPAGATATFQIVARLSAGAANGVTYNNTATVSSSTFDAVPSNNISTVGVAAVANGAILTIDPYNHSMTDLVIGTTVSTNDNIQVTAAAGGSVKVTSNGAVLGTYHPTGRILIYAGSGNDILTVASSITLTSFLFAGSGTDVLQGGGGANVLVGGSGRDVLTGGVSSNVIIGGSGVSREQAPGSSLMIGGSSIYDHNDAALASIINEWASTGIPLATRISNLRTGVNDGGVTLNTSTITLNQVADQLVDSGAVDWLWSVTGSKTGPQGATGVLNPAPGSVIN